MRGRDLLLELGTEELPPLNLEGLAAALAENVVKGLEGAAVAHGDVRPFATPRRLAVLIESCAQSAADRILERRGPSWNHAFDAQGLPTRAASAFAKSCGVEVDALEKLTTEKGAWLVFRAAEPGAATLSLLCGIVNQAIETLPIAKRMRWGARTAEFVRPVHTVLLLFGPDVVPCEVLGLKAGRSTVGHRFHAPRPIVLKTPKTYEASLRRAKVIADFVKRRESIREGVARAGRQAGGQTLIEAQLLDEVTALTEWPMPIAGRFEERFLALPREVVIATIQEHQRYFPVEDDQGNLSCWFVTVANIESRDPSQVREGNERVVRPRLADAAFFWEQDRGMSLGEHAARLVGVTFQSKLGSYADKTARIVQLAELIGADIGAPLCVGRAAELAKADLMTAMVGEFPELQGTMGRYYAVAQGEPADVAIALEEHYKPRYAGDSLPSTKTGQAVALADKIDTLVGIFTIDEKPTGAKDPFGLRRAALGVLRILLECRLDVDLPALLGAAAAAQPLHRDGTVEEVHAFIIQRLRGLLLERADGSTAEMIDAVLAGEPHSPLDVEARLQALKEFLQLPDAGVLAAANKRIANILKKAQLDEGVHVHPERFTEAAEGKLHETLLRLRAPVREAISLRRYGESLRLLTGLRESVDCFFERVLVMDEIAERRQNRLALLREVHLLLGGVADLSRLPG